MNRVIVPMSLVLAAIAGCTTAQEPSLSTSGAVLGASGATTVEYPGGRYQLYGDGTAASSHYWVWIPAGAAPPPPPPLPSTRVATAVPQGRYQLSGNGTSASPYYWVWVPAGATVVVPPPPPAHP